MDHFDDFLKSNHHYCLIFIYYLLLIQILPFILVGNVTLKFRWQLKRSIEHIYMVPKSVFISVFRSVPHVSHLYFSNTH